MCHLKTKFKFALVDQSFQIMFLKVFFIIFLNFNCFFLESQNLIKICLSFLPEHRPNLEEILLHPWLSSINKKILTKKTNSDDMTLGFFRHSWRKPFHTILHRRSIKRGRRRDADAASENVTNFGDGNCDLSNNTSSSEEECSYRQATNKVLNNNSMQCQTATPITVPQKVLDAIAASNVLSSKTAHTATVLSSSSSATSINAPVNNNYLSKKIYN